MIIRQQSIKIVKIDVFAFVINILNNLLQYLLTCHKLHAPFNIVV